jgi:hypothetical protein
MKMFLIQILLLVSLCSCQGQKCNDLPQEFESFYTAKIKILNTEFEVEDTFDTSRSSWIKSAHYYTCNRKTGFLIISTKTDSYIHQEVPLELWRKLKEASSIGSFYNMNILNNYQLTPNTSSKN